jgi:hypothetical protein
VGSKIELGRKEKTELDQVGGCKAEQWRERTECILVAFGVCLFSVRLRLYSG